MKANEAPEKIYISNFGSELSYDWHTEHCYEKDIEYTRTDAFIENACEFIAGNMTCDGYTLQTKAKFIKEFRNYMKGE